MRSFTHLTKIYCEQTREIVQVTKMADCCQEPELGMFPKQNNRERLGQETRSLARGKSKAHGG